MNAVRSRVSFAAAAADNANTTEIAQTSVVSMADGTTPSEDTSSSRRPSIWNRVKRNSMAAGPSTNDEDQTSTRTQRSGSGIATTSDAKSKIGLLAAIMSAAKKTLAEEVREERLEEMQEASELRNCSLSNVCATFHPARRSSSYRLGFGGISRSGSYAAAQPASMTTTNTNLQVVLHEITHIPNKELLLPVGEIPTFSFTTKIYFLFNGIPNVLRRAEELRPWLLPSSVVTNLTLLVVCLSCISFCIESLPDFYYADPPPVYMQVISYICMVWLSIDLGMRIMFCPDLIAMLQFPLTWVDFISNVPYYIEAISGQRIARILILIRILRLTRILRVLALSKHDVGMRSAVTAIKRSAEGLTLFMLLLTVIMFIGSSLIYISETTEESFDNHSNFWYYTDTMVVSPFQSILHALWFVITTITTVGYGDDVVITPLGKAVASVLMLVGPFVIAFPTVVLSSHFQESHREILEAELSHERQELSVEESRNFHQKKTNEFASVMRQYVPNNVREDISKKEALTHLVEQESLTYAMSVGAPSRGIVIKQGIALYDPLLLLRCANPSGEPEYGFQSSTGVMMTVRDNFPHGSVVRFQVLLHTEYTQEAAIMAVHQYVKSHPEAAISTVAPRPIRTLRVSFSSKHSLLSRVHVACNKFHDPFGTVPVELVVLKPEALPVLLRYSSSCSFHFRCEYHDSTATEMTTMLDLPLGKAVVDYRATKSSELFAKMLQTTFPNSLACDKECGSSN